MAQTLLNLAPNLYELLLLREWIQLAESQDLIVDAPSSGNFLSLIDCPKTAIRVFDGGSMRAIADEVEAFFQTQKTVIHIVTLPENSSLQEMEHIENEIQSKYPMFSIKKILNRLHSPTAPLPELSDRLRRLQLNRPLRERERAKLYPFEHQILEGATSL
jgi:anion-transporting  ArsA/GET3 family ATPase